MAIASDTVNYSFNLVSNMSQTVSANRGVLPMQKSRGMTDPLEVVAEDIVEEAILQCIDEFMVCTNSPIWKDWKLRAMHLLVSLLVLPSEDRVFGLLQDVSCCRVLLIVGANFFLLHVQRSQMLPMHSSWIDYLTICSNKDWWVGYTLSSHAPSFNVCVQLLYYIDVVGILLMF